MINSKELFDLSQLAEASYAHLEFVIDQSQLITQLQKTKFSLQQAEDLASDWQVVTGGHQPNTENGYSSTLFKNTDGSYVLAFRGTEGLLSDDLWKADIGGIVGNGLALKQIVDLYNEWQRITAAQGASYNAAHLSYLATESAAYTDAMLKLSDHDPDVRAFAQEAIDALKARTDIVFDGTAAYTIEFVDSAALFVDERATGLGLAGDIAAHGLTVTGHSLGGHLATAFTRLFPETGASALTVNGAGYPTGTTPGLSGMALSNISNLISMLGGQTSFDAGRIQNVFGERSLEMVTMNETWGLVQPGEHMPIFIERAGLNETFGHSAGQMTDSLAVYDLLIRLDSNLQTSNPEDALSYLTQLFEASANQAKFSLENLTASLAKLFGATTSTVVNTEASREQLYQAVQSIREAPMYQQAEGLLTVGVVNSGLASLAESSIAARYALANLTPFVIFGDDGLYAAHNANGELDLYDPTTGQGQMTEQWLQDRSDMLIFELNYNRNDIDYSDYLNSDDYTNTAGFVGNWHYTDYSQGRMGGHLRLGIDGQGLAVPYQQIKFGSDQGELLTGLDKDDHLYGGKGADVLNGKGGADYLEGGEGKDTYQAGAGDTILDTDRQGAVLFDDVKLTGGHLQDDGSYLSVDGKFSYHLENQVLTVTQIATGGVLTIKNYRDSGDLGIELGDPEPAYVPPSSTASNFLQGDLAPKRDKDDQIIYDMWGNIVPDDSDGDGVFDAEPGRADMISDTSGSDLIQAFAGNDQVQRRYGGDDVVFLGDGDDILETVLGVSGRVNADGGAGRDYVGGGLADDLLPTRHITYGMTIDDPRDEFPIRSTVPTCRQIDVISGNSHTAKRNRPVSPGGWKRAAELGMQGSMTLPH